MQRSSFSFHATVADPDGSEPFDLDRSARDRFDDSTDVQRAIALATFRACGRARPAARRTLGIAPNPRVPLSTNIRPGLPVVMEQERTYGKPGRRRAKLSWARARGGTRWNRVRAAGYQLRSWCWRCGSGREQLQHRVEVRALQRLPSAGASWRSAQARAPRGRPWSPRAACPSAKPVISVVENQARRTASGQAPPGPKARRWWCKTRIAQPSRLGRDHRRIGAMTMRSRLGGSRCWGTFLR